MTATDKLFLVIPCFNEAQVIAQTVSHALTLTPNVLVVDDGSTDPSAQLAQAAGAQVIRHPTNLGQGAALQTGITAALQLGAKWVCTFDADGQHQISDVASMLRTAQHTGATAVLGSRFLAAPARHRVPISKRFALPLLARLGAGRQLHLTDTHNGLRLLHHSAASQLKITQAGMAHASELVWQLAQLANQGKVTVTECPVTIFYTDYSLHKGQHLTGGLRILWDLWLSKRQQQSPRTALRCCAVACAAAVTANFAGLKFRFFPRNLLLLNRSVAAGSAFYLASRLLINAAVHSREAAAAQVKKVRARALHDMRPSRN